MTSDNQVTHGLDNSMSSYPITPRNNDLLSPSDLIEVTGAKQSTKQAEILAKAGIYFWNRIDGSIATCWHHVHYPNANQKNDQPDFSWIKQEQYNPLN